MSSGENFYLVYALQKALKYWKIGFFLLFFVLIALCFRIFSGKDLSHTKPYIARIFIEGTITTNNDMSENFIKLIKDKSVVGVILEINSGGGTVTGSEILYNNVLNLSKAKPTVALINDLGASGAYMAALGADHIIAHKSSIVGSIGVIMQNIKVSEALKKVGVEMDIYKSSEFKASPTAFEPSTPEIREYVQENIMEAFDFFKTLVLQRRKLSEDELNAVANGKIFSGTKALDLKLIDEVGTYDNAVNYLQIKRKLGKQAEVENYNFVKNADFVDKIIDKLTKRQKDSLKILAQVPF
jgi:protease-4